MRGQKRPARDRSQALGIAVVDGAAAASRQTGIPENTIRTWMDTPEFVELRERTKDVVTAEWWGFVQKAFRRTAHLLDETEDPVKAATAGAIIFDKMALSRGEATSRSENRSLSDELDDHERATLKGILEDVAQGEDPGSDPGARVDAAPAPDTA